MSEKITKVIEMTKENYEICKRRAEKLEDLLADNELDDYLAKVDIYNTTYYVDESLDFEGVRICTDWGGPAIYIDTWQGKIQLYWWSQYAEYELDSDVSEVINNYWREHYEMSRC